MNKKFLTHRILPILFVFLFCIFLFTTSCFASFDFTYDNTDYSFPDLPSDINNKLYVITSPGYNGQQLFIFADSDLNSSLYHCKSTYLSINRDNYASNIIIYTYDGSSWVGPSTYKDCDLNSRSLIYSNCDIYDVSGELFFRKTPSLYQIPIITEAKQIPEVMEGTLKILIPVGLVLLAIGLVIWVIRLVRLRLM
ncbi:MAG: hypothetical protein ACLU8F_06500 [Clostridia bacterium]